MAPGDAGTEDVARDTSCVCRHTGQAYWRVRVQLGALVQTAVRNFDRYTSLGIVTAHMG